MTDEGREWFAIAVELDAENRELRRALIAVVCWIAEKQDLLELARAEIDRRWPREPA